MSNFRRIVIFANLALCFASLLPNCESIPVPINMEPNLDGNAEKDTIAGSVPLMSTIEDTKSNESLMNSETSLIDQISNLTSLHFDNVKDAETEKNKNEMDFDFANRDGRAISVNRGPLESDSFASSTNPRSPITTGSINNFFDNFRSSFRRILQTGNANSLRAIGTLDKGLAVQQDRLQKSSFNLVLQGQKIAARAYDLTPKFVNRLIQRFGTSRDNGIYKQLNQVVNQYRDNSNKFYDAFEEHEHDFHNVFQKVWPSVNQNLGVPELPRMANLGWY